MDFAQKQLVCPQEALASQALVSAALHRHGQDQRPATCKSIAVLGCQAHVQHGVAAWPADLARQSLLATALRRGLRWLVAVRSFVNLVQQVRIGVRPFPVAPGSQCLGLRSQHNQMAEVRLAAQPLPGHATLQGAPQQLQIAPA